MVAHHSVLIFDVLGVHEMLSGKTPEPVAGHGDHKVISDLAEVWAGISQKNVQEAYHDSLQLKEEAATLFSLGYLDLRARARVERLFWDCCEKILRIARELPYVPEDLETAREGPRPTPTTATSPSSSRRPTTGRSKQLFPVMPIHRLDEKPTRRGVLRRSHLRQRRQDRQVHRSRAT